MSRNWNLEALHKVLRFHQTITWLVMRTGNFIVCFWENVKRPSILISESDKTWLPTGKMHSPSYVWWSPNSFVWTHILYFSIAFSSINDLLVDWLPNATPAFPVHRLPLCAWHISSWFPTTGYRTGRNLRMNHTQPLWRVGLPCKGTLTNIIHPPLNNLHECSNTFLNCQIMNLTKGRT